MTFFSPIADFRFGMNFAFGNMLGNTLGAVVAGLSNQFLGCWNSPFGWFGGYSGPSYMFDCGSASLPLNPTISFGDSIFNGYSTDSSQQNYGFIGSNFDTFGGTSNALGGYNLPALHFEYPPIASSDSLFVPSVIPSYEFPALWGTIISGSSASDNAKGGNNRRKYNGTMAEQLIQTAKYYLGKVNSDAEGNRLFSGGKSRQWCADFVSYCVQEAYGDKIPSDFGKAQRNGEKYDKCSVFGLMYWAQDNDCYMELPLNVSDSKKKEFIVQNVKPGDIMIEKRGGKSHTGIVTKVNPDGSFETIEGNCGNKVKRCKYKATSPTLSGFISLDKWA